jgi:hypothetical protein
VPFGKLLDEGMNKLLDEDSETNGKCTEAAERVAPWP